MANNLKYREIEGFLADDATYTSILSASDFACSNAQEIPIILIDGAEGLGKRLITEIIINKYKELFSEKVIVHHWTGEDITDLFIKSLHGKKKQQFIDVIYKPDILVISDFNYLERKYETTLELLRCMKKRSAKENGKLIIITGNMNNFNMESIANEITNKAFRLDIPFPGFYIRKEITLREFKRNDMNPDEKIIELIADKVISNMSILKGIVEELIFYQKKSESPLTYRFVRSRLIQRARYLGEYI